MYSNLSKCSNADICYSTLVKIQIVKICLSNCKIVFIQGNIKIILLLCQYRSLFSFYCKMFHCDYKYTIWCCILISNIYYMESPLPGLVGTSLLAITGWLSPRKHLISLLWRWCREIQHSQGQTVLSRDYIWNNLQVDITAQCQWTDIMLKLWD